MILYKRLLDIICHATWLIVLQHLLASMKAILAAGERDWMEFVTPRYDICFLNYSPPSGTGAMCMFSWCCHGNLPPENHPVCSIFLLPWQQTWACVTNMCHLFVLNQSATFLISRDYSRPMREQHMITWSVQWSYLGRKIRPDNCIKWGLHCGCFGELYLLHITPSYVRWLAGF